MALVRLAEFPGGTKEQYLAVVDKMTDPSPPGPSFTLQGRWRAAGRSLGIWKSRAEMERFGRETLFPAFKQAGVAGFPAQPEIVDVELHDLTLGT